MNNYKFSDLTNKDKVSSLRKIRAYRGDSKWIEMFELTEMILTNENEINNANRCFWYNQAIALDVLGRPSEAVIIFSSLADKYPLNFKYNNSMSLVAHNLCYLAKKKFKTDLANPDIEKYVKAALAADFCTWGLMRMYIDHLLIVQQTEKARQLVLDYIELAPYDVDYLKKGLEVAFKIKDSNLIKKLLNHVQKGLQQQPYNENYIEILDLYLGGPEMAQVS